MVRHNLMAILATAAVGGLVASVALAQTPSGRTATVTENAPIYLLADVSRVPLRVLEPGTVVKVLGEEGDWVQVQFEDVQWGRRAGWVQRSLLKFNAWVPPPMYRPEPRTATATPPPPAPPSPPLSSFPQAEAAIGWSFVRADTGINSRLGLNGSVVGNLTPWFGVVFDASVNRFSGRASGVVDWSEMMYVALAGGRVALRQFRTVVPYAQLLAGYARTNLNFPGEPARHDYFVIQPGGGVEIGEGRMATRFEASWCRLSNSSGPWSQFRVVVGGVYRSAPRGEHRSEGW